MEKLMKKYPVVYKDDEVIVFPTKEGINGEVYPAKGTEYAEFNTYDEAKCFIENKRLKVNESI